MRSRFAVRACRLTATADGATYAYDLNGSMTNRNGVTLTWNLFGRLMSVGDVSYWRDEQQRLCSKEVGGEPVKDWMWSGSRLVAEYDSAADEISVFVYAGATAPAYMIRGGVTYRFITDNQGSVRLVVDSETGEVMQRLDYDSFGRVLCDTNPGFQPFAFQGGLYDPDTGLVEFGCRWYDAETGRWISKDPIGLSGGMNLYEFCEDNPLVFQDPSGLVNLNLFPPWQEISTFADSHNPSGVFSVGAHGNEAGIGWPFEDQAPRGEPLISPERLADRIKNHPAFVGQPVQLDVCNVGNGTYAKELANLLGVEVRAPNRPAWYNSSGLLGYYGSTWIDGEPRIDCNDRGRLMSFFPDPPSHPSNPKK